MACDRGDRSDGTPGGELRHIRRLNQSLARGVRFDLGRRCPGGYVGILTIEMPAGRLSAESAFGSSTSLRATLMDLAGCVAECAMSLGVGASIIRGRSRGWAREYP